jgi:hypothetical protein
MLVRLVRICLVAAVLTVLCAGFVIAAKKPPVPSNCPRPNPRCVCYDLYAPVTCGPDNCWYSNDCFAGCAGWSAGQCTAVGPGPIPVE